jgi:biopolymer transport protein ExbD
MILRFRRARRAPPADINITAFMNLMVVLVPFLLITVVFTQMAIQELNLPEGGPAKAEAPPVEPLTVTVRQRALAVSGAGAGGTRTLPVGNDGHDFAALSQLLKQIKAQRPDEDRIIVRLEPDIAYDTLIQVMDAARYDPDETPLREMFPQISIGDAS